jgi:hypothetical protein
MTMSEQQINVGLNHSIGKVTIDSARVTGEGGATRPQLVVPLSFALRGRGAGAGQIAITSLSCQISTDQQASPHKAVCASVTQSLIKNMAVASQAYEWSPNVTLRFPLTLGEIASLEADRHVHPGELGVNLYLGIEASVVGLHTVGPGQTEQGPWDSQMGISSYFGHFWNVEISALALQISQQDWVQKILPGLGYDRLRLVEIHLPPPLPSHGSAATEFDKARRSFDERRYGDCVGACRGLVNIWNGLRAASKSTPMGDVLAKERQWGQDDPRRKFVNEIWKAVIDIVNTAHHPEGQSRPQEFNAADAQLVLYLVTILSEYLGQ